MLNPNRQNYDDIIELNRPNSKHPKMNRQNRAAQFAPFAALTGHQNNVRSSERQQTYHADQNIDFDLDEPTTTDL